MITHIDLVSHS